MDKSTKQLLIRVSALQESVKEGKKLCLESAAIVRAQRDMIDELVETLEAIVLYEEELANSWNAFKEPRTIEIARKALSKLKDNAS